MKKIAGAILLSGAMAGILLSGIWGQRQTERDGGALAGAIAAVSGRIAGEKGSAGEALGQKGEEQKKIALTFDDGPHPCYTEQLLDGLKERGVAATFFVTGEHASLHPEIIQRMQEEGHLIGNHNCNATS